MATAREFRCRSHSSSRANDVSGFANLTAEDRAWAAKAREEQVGALAKVRASAEKWAASLTTALGVVGLAALLEGPKVFTGLTDDYRWWAERLFFGASVVALIAVACATAAAHASVSKILDNSGEAYKSWVGTQIGTAQLLLKSSRWLAALAVAAVLASALLLWFGGDKPSSPTVIDATGSAVCLGGSGSASASLDGVAYVVRCSP